MIGYEWYQKKKRKEMRANKREKNQNFCNKLLEGYVIKSNILYMYAWLIDDDCLSSITPLSDLWIKFTGIAGNGMGIFANNFYHLLSYFPNNFIWLL